MHSLSQCLKFITSSFYLISFHCVNNTVTYGAVAAPLAKNEEVDVQTGTESVEAKTLKNTLIQEITSGRFNLSEWPSNCPELLSDIPAQAKVSSSR